MTDDDSVTNLAAYQVRRILRGIRSSQLDIEIGFLEKRLVQKRGRLDQWAAADDERRQREIAKIEKQIEALQAERVAVWRKPL